MSANSATKKGGKKLHQQPLDSRPFLVWGLGQTGKATARYLANRQRNFALVDSRSLEQLGEEVQSWVAQGAQGFFDGSHPANWDAYQKILVSPGVPYDLPVLEEARAAGLQTLAPLAWAAAMCDAPIVAVTGSAGKSTTVSLIGHMLKSSGFQTFVGGNLGTPLISILDSGEKVDRIVLECSSFQLEATPFLDAQVTVLTNLQPNHLDRHGTMQQYADCKARLFRPLPADRWIVLKDEDEAVLSVVEGSQARRLWMGGVSSRSSRIFWDNSTLCLVRTGKETEKYSMNLFGLPGHHNRENLALAIAASRLAGANPEGIQEAIETFQGLPHRLEPVGNVADVLYLNDSKATTPDSTSKAVEALQSEGRPVRLLIGGYPKGGGFSSLREQLKETVAKSYFFGQACEELKRDLPDINFAAFPTLAGAFAAATADAVPGETVLLSPACASFDEFRNFEERGRCFQEMVKKL